LTDARSGQEVWSERYDRELGDVFALQDEVVGGVVAELRRALGSRIEHTPRDRPVGPEVWKLLVQGRAQIEVDPERAGAGRELLLRCVTLDPEFASGWAELARTDYFLHFFAVTGTDEYLVQGFDHVRRALALDSEEPVAHLTLGQLLAMRGEDEAAVASARRSIELAPGRADLRLWFGSVLQFTDRAEEAIGVLKSLTRVDPALRYMALFQLALCYERLGRSDEAIAKHRECLQANPAFYWAHVSLSVIYARLEEMNQARASLDAVLRLRPGFSIAEIPRLPIDREQWVENLRKSGLR